jgi:tetratricopeptide (TPR) repeat protein
MTPTVAPDTLQKVVAGEAPLNTFFGLGKNEIDSIAALGYRAFEQGKVQDAETIFQGLIALDNGLYYGYAGLGAMALAAEKLDDAAQYLQKAVELNPNDATVRANLGEVLLRQSKFEQAAAMFRKALELDPQQRDPGANRARAILQGMSIILAELQKVKKG